MAFGAAMAWQSTQIEAGVPYSASTMDIGGVLSYPALSIYPETPVGLAAGLPESPARVPEAHAGQQEPLYVYIPDLPKPVSVVEAASVRVSQQGGVMSISEAEAALRAAGAPEEWIPAFIAIGQCESHLSPLARGDNGNSLGWLQMWTGWARAIGVEVDALYDPVTNAKAGVHVRTVRGRFGGPGGWTCSDRLGIP